MEEWKIGNIGNTMDSLCFAPSTFGLVPLPLNQNL